MKRIALLLALFSVVMGTGWGWAAPDSTPAGAEPPLPQAQVKPYSATTSMSEVQNFAAFNKAMPLTAAAKQLLHQNLFVVRPSGLTQLFHVYENNDYLQLPSFVSSDLVLQLYHIFYDYTLRTVETDNLLPALKTLTTGMLANSVSMWKGAKDTKIKSAALKNVVFFGVADRALGLSSDLPPEALPSVRVELALMSQHGGWGVGSIFPYKLDYSQFVPRGHYTRSQALKQYFKTMMWYGLAPFALQYDGPNGPTRSDGTIRQGLLLVRGLYDTKLTSEWEKIYGPTKFYVGAADDLTPAEWKGVSDQVYGPGVVEDSPGAAFADDSKLDAFVSGVEKLRPAKIQANVVMQKDLPQPDVQLRLMGQRYIPDSEVLQKLSVPVERVFPSGLDVMAVLGSTRAAENADAFPTIYNTRNWAGYKPKRDQLTSDFAALKPDTWTSNLYWSWLYSLQALLQPVGEGYPSFMQNKAWQDKALNTSLASWSELRHDTILYGKQSTTECGDGSERKFVKGYVEPDVLFYRRLLALTQQSRQGLVSRNLLSPDLTDKFEGFDDLLTLLQNISVKELQNQKLSEKEYNEIRYIGGKFEQLTLSVMTGHPSNWDLVSETDKNMAVVADVHTGDGDVLEEGVGGANEIFVIVPIEGHLSLTRGAIFSYYEFKQPMSDRLTDEKWHTLLKDGAAPAPPIWTRTFLAPGKAKTIDASKLEGYSSGC
ncbi:MAG: DUF3160 domain-containing protein [Armatimonadota bacterium]|nr:DUF3160 domain-containing protein [Armatimonadota bacterium]